MAEGYTGPNKGIEAWRLQWLRLSQHNGTSPRHRLASELKYIRTAHGTGESRKYRDNLLWLGSYPVKRTEG